ncbi:MAG: RecQ family ATP-dependent DNA helicase, partial [Balneolaceae bacterium]
EGLVLVISPLISLMQDQVEQLQQAGIRATFINSMIPAYETEQRLVNARNNMYRLIYVAPERLDTILWKNMAPDLNIALVAVDEAHCISQWGHDFRPAYRTIRTALDYLSDETRWMALSATATPEVKQDIVENLQLREPVIVAKGFDRANLLWWVSQVERKKEQLLAAVTRGVEKGSGIVYAGTREQCEKWASEFTRRGIESKAYHAGLNGEIRQSVQAGWMDGDFPVVVATNAFGMGIDKPDCRFVIHLEIPFTTEAYYQEAGRAGRDGSRGYPLLLYKESDYHKAKSRIIRSYPDLETMIQVYDALCDELSLAVGSIQEEAELVPVASVARRASLSQSAVHSSLRVLERLLIIEVLTHSEPRLGIRFIVSEEVLRDAIQSMKPAKADFLDLLFRQYGPMSFRQLHYLDVSYLTTKLNVSRDKLVKAVQLFSEQDKLLVYQLADREPLIRLCESRMGRLSVTREEVEHYRGVLLKKLEYMKGYAESTGCREVYLRYYFGETDARPCGHCDNCLKKKQQHTELLPDLSALREVLREPKSIQSLTADLGASPEDVKRWLQLLIREERVVIVDEEHGLYQWAEQ